MNESNDLSRREFGKGALSALASFSFLQTLVTACSSGSVEVAGNADRIVLSKAAPIVRHWAIELDGYSRDLKSASIEPRVWQEHTERLFGAIELPELLAFIDFEVLKNRLRFPDRGVGTQIVSFPPLSGLPESTVFVKKIFGMKKGRAIVPHGHSNMASAHLILSGEFSLRQYEKLEDRGKTLLIRPTVERNARTGESSSISDDKDNVHWFIANSDQAYTFDVIVLDLNGKEYDIHNLDIDAATRTSTGELVAPKIDVQTALKKYGKLHHHSEGTMP